ncbi:transglycosylase domain-containing protein [Sphingomicrobium astaxanthinifaciens]|uniref:transglycosylase domain-containing protein n=1 Tax=Sphingomicrobium astaxanthinifaciens TaxID=1227949 RepID=UPI001FCC3A65|nr:PBP1A family penicillin-binding protein [Sphingomicrobium astaxanthinifaciens]MCJ7421159.1 PBP1A family penicillin-binding protein [Sphingomicrobium astaxanthinifaciens]
MSQSIRKIAFRLAKWGAALAVLGVLALAAAVFIAYQSLPSYEQLRTRTDLGQTIRVRAADDSILVSMGPSFGRWLAYDEIPLTMKEAMVAVEDRRFRSHPGVDPIGIARGMWVSIKAGDGPGGARGVSTITQQVARNIFLTPDRSLVRKMREGVIALALEQKFSKDQILELYLNRVYFGGGAYGIDAASNTFFGHPATEMTLGEATIIAGLVKAPSNYSPTADPEAARGRASVVLDSMVRYGFVSAQEAAEVDPAEINIQKPMGGNASRYFVDWALPQLDTLIRETSEAIDVYTTLDPKMQQWASEAVNAHAPAGAQGALVAIDRDGAVRAMIGGKDYVESIYNRAAVARRQPGSAFKLFVYLTALERGLRPDDVVMDEAVTIDGWTPRNANRTFLGPITLREAFARSVNTISAQIGQEMGFGTIAAMASRFGISDPIDTYPSMVLGTSEVRLLDMTRAYAAVARGGVSLPPYAITKVVTAEGRLLYSHQPAAPRVLVAPWVAADMIDLLQTGVRSGTGRAAYLGRPTAGKTGTTQSNRDGWFIGFSSGLTAGVWMGNDDNRPVRGLQGGTAPARAFRDFMSRAVAGRPVEPFETPGELPDWQLEPDEEAWMEGDPLLDPYGAPIEAEPLDPLAPLPGEGPPAVDEDWLDDVLRRDGPRPNPLERPAPPPAPPAPQPRARDNPEAVRVEPLVPPSGADQPQPRR